MFCPKCGSMLLPKQIDSKRVLACSCGHKSAESATMKETVTQTKVVHVVEHDESSVLPLVDGRCKKCGHAKAYFWELQTRAADEAATRFYKCEKCKYTWRETK